MNRPVLWRLLASACAFLLIVLAHQNLHESLFIVWVAALLLAANALHVLLECGVASAAVPHATGWSERLASEIASDTAAMAVLQHQIDELQAELDVLDAQHVLDLQRQSGV